MKTKQKNKEKFYKVTGVLLALLLLASVLMLIFMPKVEEQNYFPSFVRFNDVIKQDTNLHWPCPIFDTVKQIKSDTSMGYGLYFYEYGKVEWDLVRKISYSDSWYDANFQYYDLDWNKISAPLISNDTTGFKIQKQWN